MIVKTDMYPKGIEITQGMGKDEKVRTFTIIQEYIDTIYLMLKETENIPGFYKKIKETGDIKFFIETATTCGGG